MAKLNILALLLSARFFKFEQFFSMRYLFSFIFCFGLVGVASCQIVQKDSIPAIEEDSSTDNDSLMDTILLDDVIISRNQVDYASQKEFLLLQSRVYRVYPFAKAASDRLLLLERNMAKMKTSREKKKYLKIVDEYIENEFTEKLKKLSRKQGQILVKLVNRQTGRTTFDLVKNYKSGLKAFFYSRTGKLFDIDIDKTYEPLNVNEDYLIETILQRAFETGRLEKQAAAHPVNLLELDNIWMSKAQEQAAKK